MPSIPSAASPPANAFTSKVRNQFHAALQRGDDECVMTLLHGCRQLTGSSDSKGRSPLHLASRGRCGEAVVDWLIGCASEISTDPNSKTPLHFAVSGTAPVLTPVISRLLAKSGGQIDQRDRDGRTALMTAAANGHVFAVQLLLDAGADIHAVTSHLSVDEVTGRTMRKVFGPEGGPLSWKGVLLFIFLPLGALAYGLSMLDGRIRHRRKQVEFGRTALELAALRGHEAVVGALQIEYFRRGVALSDSQIQVLKEKRFHRYQESEMAGFLNAAWLCRHAARREHEALGT